jgi:cbb3-type cytochrome oxidase cytochrome c subunit
MEVAPSLNGLSKRRTREWVIEQIRNPHAHSINTVMPAFNLSPDDMDRLIAYLFSLPQSKPFSIARLEELRVPRPTVPAIVQPPAETMIRAE